MSKRSTCITFLIVLLALIQGGAVNGAFNPVNDPALVGWWACDEGEGSVVADASVNGNDGTAVEGDLIWGPGVYGNAIELTGGLVEIPAVNITMTESTMAGWIRRIGSQPDWASLFMMRGSATGFNLVANQLAYHWGDASSTWSARPAAPVPDGEWTFCAVTVAPDVATFYINGVEVDDNVVAHGSVDWSANIYIGGDGSGSFAGRRVSDAWFDDMSLWTRPLTADEVMAIMGGLSDPALAGAPSPADEATDVPRDSLLGWKAGETAATHDVYFGTDLGAVDAASRADGMGVLVSQGQTGASYDPGRLEFSQTYYWRVDEVEAGGTIYKGTVWTFEVEPFAYAIPNIVVTTNGDSTASDPQNIVNGSGLNADDQHSVEADDMWVTMPAADGANLYLQFEFDGVYKLHEAQIWNYNVQFEKMLGFGIKNVTVEYSTDGADWAVLGDSELTQATAKATYVYNSTIAFDGVAAKYVKLTVNSGFGMLGQYGLSEVRFTYIPVQAREPEPAEGTTGVDVSSTMSWRSGREAASHEVYLGTAPDAMTLAGTADSASFAPALEFGNTYYWQIVEVNEAEAISTWAGDVWSFSTQEYALIDGFESYDDDVEAMTTIFDTWIDGWINDNGATVGYFNAPFAEKSITHSGGQSMPLAYDNTSGPFYSEAERTFDSPQNWNGNGAESLVLYVRGNAPDFAETADGSIIMNAIGADIWNTADEFRYAYKSLSGNGSITVRVDSIVRSNEWAKAGVMIRETLDPSSTHAFVAVTPEPAHGVSFQRRPVAGQASGNTDVADVAMPRWVKLTRTGDVFTAQQSADGVTWEDITPATPVSIPMSANVFIGLAVTSHDAAVATAAEFSNVSTTGNVTGAWQTEDVGVAQPMGNSGEPMYVRIADSTGKTATVVNPDAAITQRPTWQEWKIPYAELSGVNLSRVESMTIGVGSKTSPSAGGTGTVYVDDIGFGRAAAQ